MQGLLWFRKLPLKKITKFKACFGKGEVSK